MIVWRCFIFYTPVFGRDTPPFRRSAFKEELLTNQWPCYRAPTANHKRRGVGLFGIRVGEKTQRCSLRSPKLHYWISVRGGGLCFQRARRLDKAAPLRPQLSLRFAISPLGSSPSFKMTEEKNVRHIKLVCLSSFSLSRRLTLLSLVKGFYWETFNSCFGWALYRSLFLGTCIFCNLRCSLPLQDVELLDTCVLS